MSLFDCALVGCGGSLGAVSRYFVGTWVQSKTSPSSFPWGTFVINCTGSFILGLVYGLLAVGILVGVHWKPLVATGFVGAYTTFSTFEYESLQLGSSGQALANLMGSVLVGYGCVWLGYRLAYGVFSLARHSLASS